MRNGFVLDLRHFTQEELRKFLISLPDTQNKLSKHGFRLIAKKGTQTNTSDDSEKPISEIPK